MGIALDGKSQCFFFTKIRPETNCDIIVAWLWRVNTKEQKISIYEEVIKAIKYVTITKRKR